MNTDKDKQGRLQSVPDNPPQRVIGGFASLLIIVGTAVGLGAAGFFLASALFGGKELAPTGAVMGCLLGFLVGMMLLASFRNRGRPLMAMALLALGITLAIFASLYGITATCAICGAPATVENTYYRKGEAWYTPQGSAKVWFCDGCARPSQLAEYKAYGSPLRYGLVIITIGVCLASLVGAGTTHNRLAPLILRGAAAWTLVSLVYFGFWCKWSIDTLIMSMHY